MTEVYQFCMMFPKEWKPLLKRLRHWTGRPLSKTIKAHLINIINESQEDVLIYGGEVRTLEDQCMANGLPPDEPNAETLSWWIEFRRCFGILSPMLTRELELLRKEEASDRRAASRDCTV